MASNNRTSTLPETYLNLDESGAPSPLEDPNHERHDGPSLEQTLSRDNEDQRTRLDSRTISPVTDRAWRDSSNASVEAGIAPVGVDHTQIPGGHSRANGYLPRSHGQGYHGHLTELSTSAPVNQAPQAEDQASLEKPSAQSPYTSQTSTNIYTISYLIFFSIWGTLARLGLQALTVYPGAPVTQGVIWANVGGSLLMGFLLEDRSLFRETWHTSSDALSRIATDERKKRHSTLKKTIPLFIGLSTGFCGCFTSFSSWQRDAFLAMANAAGTPTASAPIPRNGGYSFLALLATLIVTPVLCLAALQVGAHLGLALAPITPHLSFHLTRRVIDPIMVPVAVLSWLGAVFLAIWPPDRPSGPSAHTTWLQETWRGDAIFACVFAPLGCLTRFYISMWLNGRRPSFPLGTFTVNIGGSILEAMFYDLQRAPIKNGIGGGHVGCQVLQGLMDGYCGSTTTISTWVAEIKGLRRRHAYVYGAVSTFTALCFMIVIMGSMLWSHGFAAIACTS